MKNVCIVVYPLTSPRAFNSDVCPYITCFKSFQGLLTCFVLSFLESAEVARSHGQHCHRGTVATVNSNLFLAVSPCLSHLFPCSSKEKKIEYRESFEAMGGLIELIMQVFEKQQCRLLQYLKDDVVVVVVVDPIIICV